EIEGNAESSLHLTRRSTSLGCPRQDIRLPHDRADHFNTGFHGGLGNLALHARRSNGRHPVTLQRLRKSSKNRAIRLRFSGHFDHVVTSAETAQTPSRIN